VDHRSHESAELLGGKEGSSSTHVNKAACDLPVAATISRPDLTPHGSTRRPNRLYGEKSVGQLETAAAIR
jgi:hypothetical protein